MHYETVFILTPVLSDQQMKEAVEKFEKVLTDNGASIVNEEIWGLRKLAYPIQKKSTGFYSLVEFDGDPTIVKKLETAFRRDETAYSASSYSVSTSMLPNMLRSVAATVLKQQLQ